MNKIYTIGHSRHSWAIFLEFLKKHSITAIVDVRSMPYSKMAEDFNRENFSKLLKQENIQYVYLGDELGGRSNDPNCIVNGRIDYSRLSETEDFQRGLDRLDQGTKKYRISLMCAEKDPLNCHRTILIARHLINRDFDVQHILENGKLESHHESIQRLLVERKLGKDLLRTEEEAIEDAYKVQAERIAYTNNNLQD